MRARLPVRFKPRSTAAILSFALVLVAPFQIGALVARTGRQTAPEAAGSPLFADPEVERSTPSIKPTPSATAHPKRQKTTRRKAPARASVFGGLGAWVDVYDFKAVGPAQAVPVMRANRVRTLYIQTGRHNTPYDVAPEVGPWLVEAHRAGLKVVGWYLPGYREMSKDIARTVAVARYRYRGHAFDGLGIDIEDKSKVRHNATWNRRVVEHADAVRARLPKYPIATITPVPIQMDVAPGRWAGFPWRGLTRASDAVMLMSYWSFRSGCPELADHCAYGYTFGNITRARALLGDPRLPIHIIGGVADLITPADVRDFVRASHAANASGASLYDFRTTDPSFWALMRSLVNL